jgi:hypothetical protein
MPNQVRSIKLTVKHQNRTRNTGEKITPPQNLGLNSGKINITAIDKSKATTPPNLLGIERRIA